MIGNAATAPSTTVETLRVKFPREEAIDALIALLASGSVEIRLEAAKAILEATK